MAPLRDATGTSHKRPLDCIDASHVHVFPEPQVPAARGPVTDPAAGRTDADLVRAIAGRDVTAFAELYDRHAGRLLALCRRMLASDGDAEEVLQDAFVQAWQQAPRFDSSRGAVAAWLLVIVRSRALDRLRALRGHAAPGDAAALELQVASTGDPEQAMSSVELSSRLRGRVEALPAAQRVALELAFFEGLTHAEIAAALRQPLGTVKTRIRLALLRLRDAIAAEGVAAGAREPSPFTIALSTYLATRAAPAVTPLLAGVTVMVVDDDEDTLDLLRTVLESAGARVLTRSSADAALSCLGECWPDVLLTDIRMPGRDGWSLAEAAHAIAGASQRALPVVAFTAGDREYAAAPARFAARLKKPAPPRAVVQLVARLCGRTEAAPLDEERSPHD